MSTFLHLCQKVAERSGTIPVLGQPEALTGQSGRLQRIINFVILAHDEVQRARSDWRWLITEFSSDVISGVQSYDAAALGISSRFSRWIHRGDDGRDTFSLYLAADGQATEGYLRYIDWSDFRHNYMIGSAATETGKPTYISENDQRKLVLWPTPDAAYTLRGRYRKGAVTWTSADAALSPEFPEDFHEIIVWRALMNLASFDEANEQFPMFADAHDRLKGQLVNDQTPRITRGGALA
ncbi:MAG: hypothetical protein KDK24_10020 [Pseudooceanicola sp.]|nr:hypothetical protein [Pseudooceanicola sp.]